MGFGSFLSALAPIAGIAAAPFTGGASLGLSAGTSGTLAGILGGVGAAGGALGAIGAGRQKGREAQAEAQAVRDKLLLSKYDSEQRAKLDAAKFGEDALRDRLDREIESPAKRAGQVALGDILSNIQASGVSGLPGYIPKIAFSGGLSPALLGPMARTAGQTLARDALLAQLTGSDIPARPDLTGLGVNAPEISELPKATGYDKFLNTIGEIGAIAGGVGKAGEEYQRKRRPIIYNTQVPGILKAAALQPVRYPGA